jgi:glycosyltransferase involved in cell wall biosynthesis
MGNKIIFSANSLWFLYNFYGSLMEEFQKLGFEVIATGKSDHSVPLLKEIGVSVIEIPFDSKCGNPVKNLSILFNYMKTFRKTKPACILNFTIKANVYGTIAARLFSIPCINTQPGLGTVFMYKSFSCIMARFLYKLTRNYPLKIFVLNEEDYKELLTRKLAEKEKLEVIRGSGIDIEKFAPMPDNNTTDSGIRLLYIGRILKDKGIYEFIDALREMQKQNIKYLCKFVGFVDADNVSAISIDEIKKWEDEGLIKYEGITNDVRPFIADCDVVLLPSKYKEGVPQSLQEASSMEKIIIATNIQGCKDVVVDGHNGFLCEPKNWKSLYDAIKKVIALSPEQRIEMGKNGRKYVSERFEKSIIYKNYLDLVDGL